MPFPFAKYNYVNCLGCLIHITNLHDDGLSTFSGCPKRIGKLNEQSENLGTHCLGIRVMHRTIKTFLLLYCNTAHLGSKHMNQYRRARGDYGESIRQHFGCITTMNCPRYAYWVCPDRDVAEQSDLFLLQHFAHFRMRIMAAQDGCTTVEYVELNKDVSMLGHSLPRLFEVAAASHLNKAAVICGDTQATYGELSTRANNFAHVLVQHGIVLGGLIGVALERYVDLVAVFLAVLEGRCCICAHRSNLSGPANQPYAHQCRSGAGRSQHQHHGYRGLLGRPVS